MKRIISTALAVIMLCTMSMSVFAADISQDDSHIANTTVKYGASVSYSVTIPDTVALDSDGLGSATVSIANAMLSSGTQLNVSVSGNSYTSGAWHLSNTAVDSEKIGYSITGADNAVTYASGDVVLSAQAGETWASTKSRVLNFALIDDAIASGQYTDTLTFALSVGEAIVDTSSLIGSYNMLSVRPTTQTAIVPDIDALDINASNVPDLETADILFQHYGVMIDSTVQIPINIKDYLGTPSDMLVHMNVHGVTPWLAAMLAGELYYAIVVYGDIDKAPEGDEEFIWMFYWEADEVTDGIAEFAAMTSAIDFTITSEPNVSDEVRLAFLNTHSKESGEPANTIEFSANNGQSTATYTAPKNAVWGEYLASNENTAFEAYRNWVVVKDTTTPVLLNARPVYTTDVIHTATYTCAPMRTTAEGIYAGAPIAPNASNSIVVEMTDEQAYLFMNDIQTLFEALWMQYKTNVVILDDVLTLCVTPWLRLEYQDIIAHVFMYGDDEACETIPYDFASTPSEYDLACASRGLMYMYGRFENTDAMTPEYEAALANTFVQIVPENGTLHRFCVCWGYESEQHYHDEWMEGQYMDGTWGSYINSPFHNQFISLNDAVMSVVDGFVYVTCGGETRALVNYSGQPVKATDRIYNVDDAGGYITYHEGMYTLRIEDCEFITHPGMTWAQWSSSIYDTITYDIYLSYESRTNYVYFSDYSGDTTVWYYICDANGNHVTKDQVMDPDMQYQLVAR